MSSEDACASNGAIVLADGDWYRWDVEALPGVLGTGLVCEGG